MTIKRTATLVAGGGALAVWLAAAATSSVHPAAPLIVSRPAAIDLKGEALASEIARLHERLRPAATPIQNRDLFRYGARAAARSSAPDESRRARQLAAPPLEVVPAAPAFKLVGIAEDAGPDGPMRTAIVSDAGTLLFVKEGDSVGAQYRVARIAAEVVELTDTATGATLRVQLR